MSTSKQDRSDSDYKAAPGPETKKPKQLPSVPVPEYDPSFPDTKPLSKSDIHPLTHV